MGPVGYLRARAGAEWGSVLPVRRGVLHFRPPPVDGAVFPFPAATPRGGLSVPGHEATRWPSLPSRETTRAAFPLPAAHGGGYPLPGHQASGWLVCSRPPGDAVAIPPQPRDHEGRLSPPGRQATKWLAISRPPSHGSGFPPQPPSHGDMLVPLVGRRGCSLLYRPPVDAVADSLTPHRRPESPTPSRPPPVRGGARPERSSAEDATCPSRRFPCLRPPGHRTCCRGRRNPGRSRRTWRTSRRSSRHPCRSFRCRQ